MERVENLGKDEIERTSGTELKDVQKRRRYKGYLGAAGDKGQLRVAIL